MLKTNNYIYNKHKKAVKHEINCDDKIRLEKARSKSYIWIKEYKCVWKIKTNRSTKRLLKSKYDEDNIENYTKLFFNTFVFNKGKSMKTPFLNHRPPNLKGTSAQERII